MKEHKYCNYNFTAKYFFFKQINLFYMQLVFRAQKSVYNNINDLKNT